MAETTNLIAEEGSGVAAYTPGPWGRECSRHWRAEQDDTSETTWLHIGQADGLPVALVVSDGDCDDDEFEANAHLISAAPELFEALSSVLEDYVTTKLRGGFEPAVIESWESVILARAALRKAKGQSK